MATGDAGGDGFRGWVVVEAAVGDVVGVGVGRCWVVGLEQG